MIITEGDIILIYILGVIVGVILSGRFDLDEGPILSFIWPIVVPVAALVSILVLLYRLGESAKPKEIEKI